MKKPLSRIAKTMKKGALTEQAARQGKTPAELCRTMGEGASTTTKRRCNLMRTFGKYRPKKRQGRR